jgi:protein-S-isoprenylcysteine O-methyltransferase Ste14
MNETQSQAPSNLATGLKIHPPLLALVLFVVTFVLHLSLPESRDVAWHHAIGLLLAVGGIGFAFFANALFHARGTTENPYAEPTQFVSQPPYTFTRNPMYLGITVTLVGLAVFFNSVVMLLAPAVFFAVLDRLVIPREEETMERIFGQQYRDYQARVRRWL